MRGGRRAGTGRPRPDGAVSDLSAAVFSLALGISSVAIPLRAVDLGYSAAVIGVFVAGSAVAQLVSRTVMGALLRTVRDKYLIAGAGVAIGASCLVFALWGDPWAFAVSQVLQGAARGLFWTSSQTHVVRSGTATAASAIGRLNLISGIGLVTGPLICGPLADATSIAVVLMIAAVMGALVLPVSLLLASLPTMRPTKSPDTLGAVWRRPGVGLANCAGVAAGGWRSLMNSYVPVLLTGTGASSTLVGVLVAGANGASIVGSALSGRVAGPRLRWWLVATIIATGVGMAVFGALSDFIVPVVIALSVAGLAAGMLQTVGPALAAESVEPDERGQALASTGTFRSASLLLVPLGVAALVPALGVAGSVAVAGGALALPVVLVRRRTA